ncbi:MAG: exo-alpha-sialidase [Ignavibacteria bacterium]|nr:exo-alpha-sialidase [Ignavibacteria bacterium]
MHSLRVLNRAFYLWLCLSVAIVVITPRAHGKQLDFTEVVYPEAPYLLTNLVKSSQNIWCHYSGQGASVYDPQSATWKQVAQYSERDRLINSCAFGNGNLATIRSSGKIEIATPDGTTLFNSLPDVKQSYSLVSLNDTSLLVACVVSARNEAQTFIVSKSAVIQMESINVDSAIGYLIFSNVANCSAPVLTVVLSWTFGGDTLSFVPDLETLSWRKLPKSYKNYDVLNFDNYSVWLNPRSGNVYRRDSCNGEDSLLTTVPRINRLERLSSGQIIGWVQSSEDTNSPLFYVSNDSGKTFTEDVRFSQLTGRISNIVDADDGSILISIKSKIFLYRQGEINVIPNPTGILWDFRSSLSRYLDDDIVLTVPRVPRSYPILDVNTLEWKAAKYRNGDEFQIQRHRVLGKNAVVSDGVYNALVSTEYDTVRPILDEKGLPVYSVLSDAIPISDTESYVSINEKWYSVNLNTGMATKLVIDWPKNVLGNYAIPTVTCVFDGVQRRILTATSMTWSLYDDENDSLITFYDRYGFLASTDNGRTWEMSNNGIGKNIYSWDMKQRGDTVYALTSYAMDKLVTLTRAAVYKSFDQGRTWTLCWVLPNGLTNPMTLEIDPRGFVYVAGGALAYSSDKGETWELINGPWADSERVYSCLVTDEGKMFVATGYQLFQTQLVSSVTDDKSEHALKPDLYWDGNYLKIAPSGATDCRDIAMFDLYGRIIQLTHTSNDTFVPENKLIQGLYFVRICSNSYHIFIE